MLSKKTKYAINALVYLAQQPIHQPIHISTISDSEHIPKKFLELILLGLRNAGLVNSKKGKAGGYFLVRKPGEINIAEVMRLFDGPIALLPCVTHNYYERCRECKDEAHCGIRNVFSHVRAETVKMLKEATIAKIIEQAGVLESMDMT